MNVTAELINGLSLGIEHITPDEDETDFTYIIVVHFFVFRFCFIKLS